VVAGGGAGWRQLADARVDVADVGGVGVEVTRRDDGEVEQRHVESAAARSDQRPRTARRPEAAVVGDGAGQVLRPVGGGVYLQSAGVLARREHRTCLDCTARRTTPSPSQPRHYRHRQS